MILRLPAGYLGTRNYLEKMIGKMERFKVTNVRANDSSLPPWDNQLYRYSFYVSRLSAQLLSDRSVDTELVARKIESEVGFINQDDFHNACRQIMSLLDAEKSMEG